MLEHLLRYFRALPTIRVHPEWDGRTLDIVHFLIVSKRGNTKSLFRSECVEPLRTNGSETQSGTSQDHV